MSSDLSLKENDEVRAMTLRPGVLPSCAMSSSASPSAEIFLIFLLAHIRERQHRNGFVADNDTGGRRHSCWVLCEPFPVSPEVSRNQRKDDQGPSHNPDPSLRYSRFDCVGGCGTTPY